MKSELANRNIINLPQLPTGFPLDRVREKYGIEQVAQLCYNECAFGPSPKAVEAMRVEAERMHYYPEPSSEVLRNALAARHGVKADEIILSNGMDNVLQMICHAFINPKDEVITCIPTFGAYQFGTAMAGGRFIGLPLKDNRFDLNAIYRAIDLKTKLIFICNPNNPTGTILKKDAIADFMAKVPEYVIVVFDEAYAEFVEDADYANGMDYVHAGRNVIVGRTFSKIYGLAGCRVGYAVAAMPLMRVLKKTAETFPVNRVAQSAAIAALYDHEFVEYVKTETSKGRRYLIEKLSELSMKPTESAGNFIWVDTNTDGKALAQKLEGSGFIVRAGFGVGYESYLRISLGTMEQNEGLITAIARII